MLSLNDIPRSALLVLDHISENGPMAPRDIARGSEIPLRTVTFALNKLVKQNLLRKVPHLMDMRMPQYRTNNERVRELHEVIDLLRAQMNIQFRAI